MKLKKKKLVLKKDLKTNRCQPKLTFETRDPSHKTEIIPSRKITEPNSKSTQYRKIKLKKIKKEPKAKIAIKRIRIKFDIKTK
jgi:hypothetical protein